MKRLNEDKPMEQKPIRNASSGRIFAVLLLLTALQSSRLLAQSTAMTYQGRVTSNGANFNGSGLFKFALVTSTNASKQATAAASLTGSFVTSCTVYTGGNGYATPPSVSFSGGGGSGASATANLSGGVVTSITVNNAGSGYISAPTVTIAPPPATLTYFTYWSNDGTSVAGSEPTAAVNVNVADGLFTVALGDTNVPGMAAMDASIFAEPGLQLRIWFNDGVHGSAPLSPLQNLTAAPYALGLVGVVQNNTITPGLYATVGGGFMNVCTNGSATVAGGFANVSGGNNATVGGGSSNVASTDDSTVAGGSGNVINYGLAATIGGGINNLCWGNFSTVAGGEYNFAPGPWSTIGGGEYNQATGTGATIGGGIFNTNRYGGYSVVPGGAYNLAQGNYSFAAGYKAQALHAGSFVWSDSSGVAFPSTANNQFAVRATGGLLFAGDVTLDTSAYHHLSLSGGNSTGFLYGAYENNTDGISMSYNYYASAPTGGSHVIRSDGATSRVTVGYGSVELAVGGVGSAPSTVMLRATTSGVCVNGTVNNCSDRNVKQDFAPVSPSEILDRVAQMPVSEWSYKMDATTRHIGPMAQDFYAAFNVGSDDKHIAPIDESGVALAAIQGLNQKLHEKDSEIRGLKERLEKLEEFIRERN